MNYPHTVAPGVMVIGRYEPTEFEPSKMGTELTQITDYLGLQSKGWGAWAGGEWQDHKTTSEIRSAKISDMIIKNPMQYNAAWHKDCPNSDDGTLCMVVWSNREQTEVKLPDDTIVCLNPGDVVLIHNQSVMHRTPPQISEDRWFFRRHVQAPTWLEIAK